MIFKNEIDGCTRHAWNFFINLDYGFQIDSVEQSMKS